MSLEYQDRLFKLVAGHPALDLVNTLDWRFRESGTEELLASYDDLLCFTSQAGLLTPKQVRQTRRAAVNSLAADALVACRELREAAAEIFYALVDEHTPAAAPLRTVERYFREARRHQRLVWIDSHSDWDWIPADPTPELPLWAISLSVTHLLLSDDLHRLRSCESDDCHWLFLDTSKNHTRRWCDMKLCGNRMKARRFKAQHRA